MRNRIMKCWIYLLPFFFAPAMSAFECQSLVISPDSVAFGTILRDTTKTVQLTVRNDGSRFNLQVDQFRFVFSRTGAFFGDVRLDFPAGTVDSNGEVRIPDNGGTITINLTLTAQGSAQTISGAEIRVEKGRLLNSSQSELLCSVPITGNIIEPLEMPAALAFGVVVSGTVKTLSVTLTANTQMDILSVETTSPYSVSESSTKSTPFSFPISLRTGQSKQIFVSVSPNAAGSINNALKIAFRLGNGATSSSSINLFTNGVLAQFPDLSGTISGVTPEIDSAGRVTMKFQLQANNSGSASGACEGKVLLDGAVVHTFQIPSINAGQSEQLSVSFTPAVTGSHQLTATLDSNNSNVELNENNNVAGPVAINIPTLVTAQPLAPPAPDLSPQIAGTPTISAAGQGKSQVTMQVKVLNSGSTSKDCEGTIKMGNQIVKTFGIQAIPSGQGLQLLVSFETNKKGSVELKATVDTNNLNVESNENNNISAPVSVTLP